MRNRSVNENFWTKVLLNALSRRAWRLWQKGDAGGALRALRGYYGRQGVQPPSDAVDPVHNLLFAQVCAVFGALEASLAACGVVRRQLDGARRSGEIAPADIDYLLCVCRAVAASLSGKEAVVGYAARRFALELPADLSRLDLSWVTPWVHKSFPLPDAYVETTEALLRNEAPEN
jgi:hypothetical protein